MPGGEGAADAGDAQLSTKGEGLYPELTHQSRLIFQETGKKILNCLNLNGETIVF